MLGQHARAGRLRDKLFPLGLLPGNRWARQAEEALADADIGTYPGSVVADLPYGIQKRIEIARALVFRTEAAVARRARGGPQPRRDPQAA